MIAALEGEGRQVKGKRLKVKGRRMIAALEGNGSIFDRNLSKKAAAFMPLPF